eukprot:11893334-Ditylum_brightwellii.AAC.1
MSPTRKKRRCSSTSSSLQPHPNKESLAKHFKDAKTKRGANSRLCGDLTDLKRHLSSAVTACGVSLHILLTTGTCAGAECFFDYQNDMFFGMA